MACNRIVEWLAAAELKQSDFAEQCGVLQGTVSRWVSGTRMPRPEQMQRIIRASRGFIQPQDFYPATRPAAAERADA